MRLIFDEKFSQQLAHVQPAFPGQFAGVLEHVRGHGQVVDSAVASIGEFQHEVFVETVRAG
jgi:hypothetical protein